MLHISTFSGIGGFDLAAEWMGWENIASCEINEFGNKVLNYYWPDAYHHDDIHTFTYEKLNTELEKRFGKNWRSDDIILSGGFPCQPYSTAGKRLGKDDERHLFPEMLRAIREIQPTWVVGENVSGLLSWNGGMVFDEVQADLEAAGYEVIPFILPSAGVGAPHRRDRIFFVAHRNECSAGSSRKSGSIEGNGSENNDEPEQRGSKTEQYNRPYEFLQPVANTNDTGANKQLRPDGNRTEENNGREGFAQFEFRTDGGDGVTQNTNGDGCGSNEREGKSGIGGFGDVGTRDNERIPANNAEVGLTSDTTQAIGKQSWNTWAGGNGNTGMGSNGNASNPGSIELQGGMHPDGTGEAERYPGSRNPRIDKCGNWDNFPTQPPVCSRNDGLSPELVGITVSKHRQESIKGYGNAIVPQVALQIFKAIEAWDKMYK